MPIGGVIAADGVIIPNAVGVDIGCGMNFVSTNIKAEDMKPVMTGNGTMFQAITGEIMRNIPVGYNSYKKRQESEVLDRCLEHASDYEKNEALFPLMEDAFYQIGTLGGGNHFIELQEDQDGYLGIMIHSGSRHFGKEICDYFHKRARELNAAWHSAVPDSYRLAFLPVDSAEGQDYIPWMNLALEYAFENRKRMMEKTLEIVAEKVEKYLDTTMEFTEHINCHHNYASLETHYGKEVWVHRKGATRAGNGEMAVIPGAWGPTAM